ncbi:hypothetical protein, partial [Staphylococcus epidermidis]
LFPGGEKIKKIQKKNFKILDLTNPVFKFFIIFFNFFYWFCPISLLVGTYRVLCVVELVLSWD